MSDPYHHAAGQAAIGTGWVATGASLLATISPDGVKEWAALAQFLAFGGFTLYLTMRKQWEEANRSSLLAQIQTLTESLDEAKRERQDLAVRINKATPVGDSATP